MENDNFDHSTLQDEFIIECPKFGMEKEREEPGI